MNVTAAQFLRHCDKKIGLLFAWERLKWRTYQEEPRWGTGQGETKRLTASHLSLFPRNIKASPSQASAFLFHCEFKLHTRSTHSSNLTRGTLLVLQSIFSAIAEFATFSKDCIPSAIYNFKNLASLVYLGICSKILNTNRFSFSVTWEYCRNVQKKFHLKTKS